MRALKGRGPHGPAPLLLFLLFPWNPSLIFATATAEAPVGSLYRHFQLRGETRRLQALGAPYKDVGLSFLGTPSEPGAAPQMQFYTSAPLPSSMHANETSEPYLFSNSGLEGTRGTPLGVQEPPSFYGNVHVADPTPVAEVPMWIWVSSTVICVLLLLLWVLHQRRFSAVAAELRLLQRRCFSPPAALHMSLVYSFFPLSGAVAWLSLLEPRGGLLLSQLRSAWEVCCLHCFMLLMLHLMGGPETTLLLLQQQHALPSPESVGKALEGTKGYANMESHQSKPIRDKEGSAPTQQQEQEEKQQTKEGIVKLEALPTITKRFGHSCNSSSSRKNNSSSSGSSEQGRNNGQSTCELSAANEGSHSLAAPTLPPSAAAASTTALTTTVAPAPAVAALTLEQSAAALRNKLSSSSVAAGAQAEAAAEAATTQPLEATAAAEEPSREGPPAAGEAKAAASASASAADGAAAHVMCRAAEGLVELPEAASGSCCVSAASSAPRRRSRWRKARKASCFTSTKCNLGCGQSIERCCCNRDDRSARDLCNSRRHDNNSSNDSSKSSTYSCPSGPQAKLSIWHRCKDKLHRHRVRLGASTSRRSSITRSITTAAGAAAPPTRETERSPLEGDPLLLPGAAPTIAAASPVCAAIAEGCNDPLAKDHRQQQQEKERQCTESADAKHRGVAGNSSGLAVSPFGAESAINSKRCLVNASPVSATAACEAEQNQEAQQEQKQQQQSEPSQQQRQQQLPSITEGGPGAAIPGSTCSTTLTNQGSSPAVLLAQRQRKTDIVSVEVQRLGPQLLPPGTRSGTDGVALERMECHAAEESHRKVWFVPPLCCLAWNTKPRPFSAWDLRMSYRCLLPFTVLKLLRVLLCYLLPTLMHLGNERDRTPGEAGAVSGGAVDTAASALGENGQQHLLQRLLQLCCFFSLVLAMWGLAVVFVATRPLLKPFNIGWKFTCLKALVLFIQLLELAAEAFQPKSRTAVPADDDAAAATAAATAAAQRVYVFTFLELLGSAVCAVMATWAYKPGDLLDAHRRLVLLQQQLPKDATVDIGGSNSCRNRKCSSNRSSGRFNLVIPGKFATARKRCNFRSIWRRNVQTKSAEANLKDHCRQVAESP